MNMAFDVLWLRCSMRVYAYRNKVQLLDGRLRLLPRVSAEADEQAMSTATSTS